MKKSYLLLIIGVALMVFTSCKKKDPVVPPVTPTPHGGEVQSMPYTQSFATDFGTYTTQDVLGDESWVIDYQTAKMTGYVNSENKEDEDWLISSPINMTGDNVIAEIQYIARYFSNFDNELTLWVSEDYIYDEYPYDFTWEQVPVEWQNSADWNTFNLKEVVLDDYIGKTVTFAVKYRSTSSA